MRLGLATAIFLTWIAFLLFQVLTTANPTIVSRPQILSAPIVIVGTLLPDRQLTVGQVLWGPSGLAGETIAVDDLPAGTDGGDYVVPVVRVGSRYRIFPIPVDLVLGENANDLSYYPATPQVKEQVRSLLEFRRTQNERSDDKSQQAQ